MQKLISDNLDSIIALCKSLRVKELYVFGSASMGKMNKDSDIDFLISFQNIPGDQYADNYFSMHYGLENYLGKKIDLLTVNSLSNPYFMDEVEKTKKLLYAA